MPLQKVNQELPTNIQVFQESIKVPLKSINPSSPSESASSIKKGSVRLSSAGHNRGPNPSDMNIPLVSPQDDDDESNFYTV